jgi:hypothetical protein
VIPRVVTGELVLMRERTLAWVHRDAAGAQLIPYPDGLPHPVSDSFVRREGELVGCMVFSDGGGNLVPPLAFR